jgi:phosphoglycolate phosphatase-like HAD superfamily hydrolase
MIDLSVDSKVIHDVGLVIFDKDGTLIELYHYWSQMVSLRARIICEALGLGTERQAGLRWALGVDEKAERLRPEGGRPPQARDRNQSCHGLSRQDRPQRHIAALRRPSSVPMRSRIADLHRFIRPIEARCP